MTQKNLSVETSGRGLYEITNLLNGIVDEFDVPAGLAHVFLQHTSASLIITENADPTVLSDLETIISRLAPDGDPSYKHDYEGDDDMAAHIRSVLTANDLTIPIQNGRLALGTWQGVFLWEHRYRPHNRKLIVSFAQPLFGINAGALQTKQEFSKADGAVRAFMQMAQAFSPNPDKSPFYVDLMVEEKGGELVISAENIPSCTISFC